MVTSSNRSRWTNLAQLTAWVAVLCVVTPVAAQVVEIPDPALEQAIRDNVGDSGFPLTQDDLSALMEFHGIGKGIVDLTGLEFAGKSQRHRCKR